jgi:cell division septation protein DedD
VASYVEEKNARSLMKDLKEQGLSPKLIKKGKATLTQHSVYLGDFSSPEEAGEMGARLQADGIRVTLKPMEKGHYSFLVSSSFVLNDAIDLAHELQKKDYSARIRSSQVQAPVYQVFVGRFSERTQTAESVQRLQEMGHSPIVVRK